jgi:hypothetical protein
MSRIKTSQDDNGLWPQCQTNMKIGGGRKRQGPLRDSESDDASSILYIRETSRTFGEKKCMVWRMRQYQISPP